MLDNYPLVRPGPLSRALLLNHGYFPYPPGLNAMWLRVQAQSLFPYMRAIRLQSPTMKAVSLAKLL